MSSIEEGYCTDLARMKERDKGLLGPATCSDAFIEDAINKLTNISSLINGWHGDGTAWTEFDEQCRKDASDLIRQLEAMRGRYFK